MQTLLFFFYTVGIHLGNLYIWAGKFYTEKLDLLWLGRQKTLRLKEQDLLPYRNCIWMHCASLGEFEQGRPLLEKLRRLHPEKKIVLTFFSPSGYEIRKNYTGADLVMYLPSDLPVNAKKLVTSLKPDLFILVKYEFWWNLLNTLQRHRVPVVLIAAIFRKEDYFLQRIFAPFQWIIRQFSYIFVQDEASYNCLKEKQFSNMFKTGDTRVDRVLQMKKEATLPQRMAEATKEKKVVVYGSVWLSDMDVVSRSVLDFPEMYHIVVPHDIVEKNITEVMSRLQRKASLFTDETWEGNVLIVNKIGILASLYSVAAYAYIGGGFGKAIHNLLEPAVYGIPVFMGPKHTKFAEAVSLREHGIAYPVQYPEELVKGITELTKNQEKYDYVKRTAVTWFTENQGATDRINERVEQFLSPKM